MVTTLAMQNLRASSKTNKNSSMAKDEIAPALPLCMAVHKQVGGFLNFHRLSSCSKPYNPYRTPKWTYTQNRNWIPVVGLGFLVWSFLGFGFCLFVFNSAWASSAIHNLMERQMVCIQTQLWRTPTWVTCWGSGTVKHPRNSPKLQLTIS